MYHATIFGQGRVTSHNPPLRTVSIRQRVETRKVHLLDTRAWKQVLGFGHPWTCQCVQTCSTGIGKAARPL